MRSEPRLEAALLFSRQAGLLPRPGEKILCAVSGGTDSMCLLHWLWTLGQAEGFSVAAGHYNHHIRPIAHRDELFVEAWCRERSIPFLSGGGDVPARASETGCGLEETARRMRYGFLLSQAEKGGFSLLATAHQADDNLETILLHLLRGTGLRGLTGIPPRRGNIVRPLLTTSRAEIEDYLAAFSIPHVEDETNQDPSYTRNRVRRELVPLLRSLRPDLLERTNQLAASLRADEALLSSMARCGLEEVPGGVRADGEALSALPDPLALRAARALIETGGGEAGGYTAAHLRAIVSLCRSPCPSGRVDLPGGRQVRREYRSIVLSTPPSLTPPSGVPAAGEGQVSFPGWILTCRRERRPSGDRPTRTHFYLREPAIGEGTLLRPRREGDRISLPGRPGKSLKKLLIDEKLPRWEREGIPVLSRGEALLAVGGFGCDAAWLAEEGELGWEISLTPVLSDKKKNQEEG